MDGYTKTELTDDQIIYSLQNSDEVTATGQLDQNNLNAILEILQTVEFKDACLEPTDENIELCAILDSAIESGYQNEVTATDLSTCVNTSGGNISTNGRQRGFIFHVGNGTIDVIHLGTGLQFQLPFFDALPVGIYLYYDNFYANIDYVMQDGDFTYLQIGMGADMQTILSFTGSLYDIAPIVIQLPIYIPLGFFGLDIDLGLRIDLTGSFNVSVSCSYTSLVTIDIERETICAIMQITDPEYYTSFKLEYEGKLYPIFSLDFGFISLVDLDPFVGYYGAAESIERDTGLTCVDYYSQPTAGIMVCGSGYSVVSLVLKALGLKDILFTSYAISPYTEDNPYRTSTHYELFGDDEQYYKVESCTKDLRKEERDDMLKNDLIIAVVVSGDDVVVANIDEMVEDAKTEIYHPSGEITFLDEISDETYQYYAPVLEAYFRICDHLAVSKLKSTFEINNELLVGFAFADITYDGKPELFIGNSWSSWNVTSRDMQIYQIYSLDENNQPYIMAGSYINNQGEFEQKIQILLDDNNSYLLLADTPSGSQVFYRYDSSVNQFVQTDSPLLAGVLIDAYVATKYISIPYKNITNKELLNLCVQYLNNYTPSNYNIDDDVSYLSQRYYLN